MAVFFTRRGEPPSTGKQLSDYAEGDIVKIPENSTPEEFYVAKHDYESGLNGAGRTLVVRKDIYTNYLRWNENSKSTYASSTIDTWFNSTYKSVLDPNVLSLIGTTKFYYTVGGGNSEIKILERSIFALSFTELGFTHSWANIEGNALFIANLLKVAYFDGKASIQWTRSPYIASEIKSWASDTDGSYLSYASSNRGGFRPAFTLPSTTKFDPNTNVIIG